MKRLLCGLVLAALFGGAFLATRTARAADPVDDPVVGINLLDSPQNLSTRDQDTTLNTLWHGGVRAIRIAIPQNAKGIAFAERVHAHRIAIDWLVGLEYTRGTPPQPPPDSPTVWRLPALSSADPNLFRSRFGKQLATLESKGIVFAAFELGDEFNWTEFNADFPLPAAGRLLDANDLANDPEGRAVAAGYRRYLASLSVLKELRDRSRFNAHTPIISGGLADLADSGDTLSNRRADAVRVDATLRFLRANGLDRLVDGYGLHAYLSSTDPGSALGPADRRSHLENNGLEQCRPTDTLGGKPCWFTEWGFGTPGDPCHADDADRVKLAREIRGIFDELAASGTLGGQFYNAREIVTAGMRPDPPSANRCRGMMASERLAISPL